MDYINRAREILRRGDLKWLELDISFPVDLWKQQSLFAEEYYVQYRDSDSQGWSSCCLHGLDIDKIYTADNYGLEEYFAPYRYTDLAYKSPSITNFWKNYFPAERYTRIRFMKLEPGGFINWHNDGVIPIDIDPLDSILPINLAISHPINCEMFIEDKKVPWAEGKVFLLNIGKTHAVFNHSSNSRVHMIANIILGNRKQEFCELLVKSFEGRKYEHN